MIFYDDSRYSIITVDNLLEFSYSIDNNLNNLVEECYNKEKQLYQETGLISTNEGVVSTFLGKILEMLKGILKKIKDFFTINFKTNAKMLMDKKFLQSIPKAPKPPVTVELNQAYPDMDTTVKIKWPTTTYGILNDLHLYEKMGDLSIDKARALFNRDVRNDKLNSYIYLKNVSIGHWFDIDDYKSPQEAQQAILDHIYGKKKDNVKFSTDDAQKVIDNYMDKMKELGNQEDMITRTINNYIKSIEKTEKTYTSASAKHNYNGNFELAKKNLSLVAKCCVEYCNSMLKDLCVCIRVYGKAINDELKQAARVIRKAVGEHDDEDIVVTNHYATALPPASA